MAGGLQFLLVGLGLLHWPCIVLSQDNSWQRPTTQHIPDDCETVGTCAWNAIQLQAQVAHAEDKQNATTGTHEMSLTGQNETSSFVITSTVLLTTVGTAAASAAVGAAVNTAWKYLNGGDDFKHAVGLTGLPLTLGVINDTPGPIKYDSFEMKDSHGEIWGYPALGRTVKPGEMLQWFLYTPTTGVSATMLFKNGDNCWAVAAAQYRLGNTFWDTPHCDRLRIKVSRSCDMNEPWEDLCTAQGRGIAVKGGYQATVFLQEAGHD